MVHKTIESILNQKKVKPDKVALFLASEQFPEKEKELPAKLLGLVDYGLEIKWCPDYRSYKKLVPAISEWPDSIIVTADDDVFYQKDWLQRLYDAYLLNPQNIYCHKATKFYMDEEGVYQAVGGGRSYYTEPSFLNKLVGIGGVLYPPSSLDRDVLDVTKFTSLAPTNDDIWFWLMAVRHGTRICVVKRNTPKPIALPQSYATDKLCDINNRGAMLFWVQLHDILKAYPEIDRLLRSEESRQHKS